MPDAKKPSFKIKGTHINGHEAEQLRTTARNRGELNFSIGELLRMGFTTIVIEVDSDNS